LLEKTFLGRGDVFFNLGAIAEDCSQAISFGRSYYRLVSPQQSQLPFSPDKRAVNSGIAYWRDELPRLTLGVNYV
jgi:hypothetical protein